jgi:Secretion system C-terminal sorting domain
MYHWAAIQRRSSSNDLYEDNVTIPAYAIWQKYDITVNDIYTKVVLAGQAFSSDDAIRLEQIAMLCPADGGEAVYRARSLYYILIPESKPFDEIPCDRKEEDTIRERTEEVKDMTSQLATILSLQPNPASTQVQVNLTLPDGFEGQLQVMDVLGRTYTTQPVQAQQQVALSTAHWQRGVYICLLKDREGRVQDMARLLIH